MPSYDSDPSPLWKPVAFGLLVVVIAMLAYGMGRQSSPAPPLAVTPEAARLPDRAVSDLTPEPARPDADFTVPTIPFELPVVERESRAAVEEPTPLPAPTEPPAAAYAPALDERPREDAESCLTILATPNRIEVYGASGPAVQLLVRVRNRCGQAFSGPGTYFRAYATAPGGFDLARATGRFQGSIPAWGSAETLIALECDPTRVAQYRVELWR